MGAVSGLSPEDLKQLIDTRLGEVATKINEFIKERDEAIAKERARALYWEAEVRYLLGEEDEDDWGL